ncbi:hypothetical protein ZIOFF_019340 [Zingiber officinale]|uniref:glucose-1-phosphate adenylyltransferase n=1 Tax=Zingiber officinale TaxID=94328 RepID=A0A8J5H9D8_ZINOF|nr:hypothetical protein ZIOFF_019340 [Zingiber officinale]
MDAGVVSLKANDAWLSHARRSALCASSTRKQLPSQKFSFKNNNTLRCKIASFESSVASSPPAEIDHQIQKISEAQVFLHVLLLPPTDDPFTRMTNQTKTLFLQVLLSPNVPDPKNVTTFILGGGTGAHLFPLTNTRAVPAVPIAGGYKIVDVPMSNCINKIYILTQFNSTSLNRHIYRTFGSSRETEGRMMAPFSDCHIKIQRSTPISHPWGFMSSIERLFKDNSCISFNSYGRANDFGQHILPFAVNYFNVQAYMFQDYWEDIGTLKAFYNAILALTEQSPKFQFYDQRTPMYTSPRCAVRSFLMYKCDIERSIIGVRSRISAGAEIKVKHFDVWREYLQTDEQIASLSEKGMVPIGVGQNTKIRNCIIDTNARIGQNVVISNKDGVEEADRSSEGFYIRSGITIILRNATIKDGTVI